MYYRFIGLKDGQWKYRNNREESSKAVDTFALERILGVIGGPEVIVVREDLRTCQVCHVTVKNGFVTQAELLGENGERLPTQEFTFKAISL